MIIGNGSVYNKNPMNQLGGAAFLNTHIQNRPPVVRWRATSFGKTHSRPLGAQAPYAWIIPKKGGELSCIRDIVGSGSVVLDSLSMGVACAAGLAGSGDITAAPLSMVIQFLASLAGSGNITAAALVGTLSMAADLAGEGDIDGAMGLIAWCVSGLLGAGVASGTMRGEASMAADITTQGDLLTAQACAYAVWSALSSVYNDPGTMGAKLNAASAAGDPWTAELPGTYPEGSAGYILSHQEHTLSDEVVEGSITVGDVLRLVSSILAGKASGGGTSAIRFRNISDTKDRATLAVDEKGNRSSVVLDLSE